MITIKNRWNGDVIKKIDAADLRGSDLSDCDLRDCDLRGCDLRDSNLRVANLRGSNLSGCELRGSDFRDCDLSGSDLRDSDLRGANLSGSNLRDSDLRGANLRDSNLSGCELRGSDLRDAKNAPIVINGLRWFVQISGTGWMQIGCQKHSVSEWSSFDDERIAEMESDALPFWQANKIMLLALCEQWIHPAEDEVQS